MSEVASKSMTSRASSPVRLVQDQAGSLLSCALLGLVLGSAPLVLGAARTWIILPLLLVLWILLAVQAARLWINSPRLVGRILDLPDLFVIAFVFYTVIRYFTSPVEYLSRLELFNVTAYATIFFSCRYGIVRRNHAIGLLAWLVIIGAGVAGFAFFLRLNPDIRPFGDDLHVYYWPRLTGTYGCPNHFGGFLVMTCGIALAFALFSHMPWIWRIVCLYFALMMIVGIIFSVSRGSWIGLLCSFAALTYFAIRSGTVRWFWPVAGFAMLIACAAGFILSSPHMMGRIREAQTIVETGAWTSYVRIQLAMDSWKIFQDYPVFGTGPATFMHMHPRYQSVGYGTLAIYTHDDYINLLTDYGLVGFALMLGFLITVTPKMFRSLGSKPEPRDRVLLASGCAAWCALLVHSVVDFNMHIPANAMILFALTGVALRHSVSRESRSGWFDKQKFARIASGCLALLALLFTGFTVKTALGYYPTVFAEQNYTEKSLPELREKALHAAAMDPNSPIALKLVGDLYRVQAARTENIEERVALAQEAATWYERASDVNPLDDTITVHRAIAYDLMGRNSEAYILYQNAIKKQPFNGYFRTLLGLHLWRRNELEKAREAFVEATHAANGTAEAQNALDQLNHILGVGEKPAAEQTGAAVEQPAAADETATAVKSQERSKNAAPAAAEVIPAYHAQPFTMTPEPSDLHEPKPGEQRAVPQHEVQAASELAPQTKPYSVKPRSNQPANEPLPEIIP